MVQIKPESDDLSVETIRLQIDDTDLEFENAAALAKAAAKNRSADAMMLSWYDRKANRYHPRFECGRSGKPAWVVFAESRGSNLTIDINDGEFVFMYLKL